MSAMGRYVELYIATPMYSSELCIVRRRPPVADGVFIGPREKSVVVELYIVFRCSGVASSLYGRLMCLLQLGVDLRAIAR